MNKLYKAIRIELKWAILYALLQLTWMLFERVMGWHSTGIRHYESYVLLFILPSFAMYYLALLDKRNNYYNGNIRWIQAFVSGVVISAFVAILSPLTQYLTSYYISPDFFDNAIEYRVNVERMPREIAEAYYNFSSYIVKNIQGALIHGTITSALVAMTVQRTK